MRALFASWASCCASSRRFNERFVECGGCACDVSAATRVCFAFASKAYGEKGPALKIGQRGLCSVTLHQTRHNQYHYQNVRETRTGDCSAFGVHALAPERKYDEQRALKRATRSRGFREGGRRLGLPTGPV